jgi:hypothetical protein
MRFLESFFSSSDARKRLGSDVDLAEPELAEDGRQVVLVDALPWPRARTACCPARGPTRSRSGLRTSPCVLGLALSCKRGAVIGGGASRRCRGNGMAACGTSSRGWATRRRTEPLYGPSSHGPTGFEKLIPDVFRGNGTTVPARQTILGRALASKRGAIVGGHRARASQTAARAISRRSYEPAQPARRQNPALIQLSTRSGRRMN